MRGKRLEELLHVFHFHHIIVETTLFLHEKTPLDSRAPTSARVSLPTFSLSLPWLVQADRVQVGNFILLLAAFQGTIFFFHLLVLINKGLCTKDQNQCDVYTLFAEKYQNGRQWQVDMKIPRRNIGEKGVAGLAPIRDRNSLWPQGVIPYTISYSIRKLFPV